MKIAHHAVKRPVMTTMLALVVILLGGISLSRLPVDLMPDVTRPRISIRTTYENASPEEIEQLITRPIEDAVSATPGVEEVTSTSSEGNSSVRVSFNWSANIDEAANDVRSRLDRVRSRLPEEAETPILWKADLAGFPVLILGASSDLDPVRMRMIIEDQIKDRIEQVPGVAALDIRGGLMREIRVSLLPEKIKGLGLPLDGVIARIKSANLNLPAGTIDRGNYEVTVRTPGEYVDVEELNNQVIATRGPSLVRLRDVAVVQDTSQRVRQYVRVNGRSGVMMSVTKQSGTNTVDVVDGVRAEIDRINHDFPQIHLVPIIDSSDYIRRAIANVGSSAVYGGLLAVMVLLLFLRNIRSTIIIAVSIPISIVATFGLMYFGGMTVNIMTLGGLALGVGMLVDNSIVVLENIYRLHEQGMAIEEAAIEGTHEVTAAVFASTLTTVAVFLPVVFMQGMTGIMFMQMALVVSCALLCSLVSSLTMVPMLAVKILRLQKMQKGFIARLYRASERFFISLEEGYKGMLHVSLAHRLIVIIGAVAAIGASVLLVPLVGSELMPATDESEVRITAEMEVGTRLDIVNEQIKKLEAIVATVVGKDAQSVVASVGADSWRGGSSSRGEMRVSLVNVSQRTRSSEQVAEELRKALVRKIPGLDVRVRTGQGLMGRLMGSNDEKLEVEVRGHDIPTADALAARVAGLVDSVEGVTDIKISRESGTPEELIVIDRSKAADLKLTVQQIAEMLQTLVSGTQAGYYRDAGKEYDIRVILKDAEKRDLQDILDLTITNAEGQPVALRNVLKSAPRLGPVLIERVNRQRVVTVQANTGQRDMGSVIADVQTKLASVPVPRDFTIAYRGDYEEQQKSFGELLLAIVLSLVLVYMVMACQYESLRDPFVVMFSVPLAVIGVVLTLLLTHTTFNMQSYIGCIMLGGIVVNNAILLVDTINLLRRRDGMELRAAIEEAGRRRLRPILMTALTTILGLLPLALGLGDGGEAQAPMARAVVGGLATSALITLVFVPVIYSIFERKAHKTPLTDPVD
ncbi:MAG: efflux RND transporter permease subunit [Planctomycetaceae bacterium]